MKNAYLHAGVGEKSKKMKKILFIRHGKAKRNSESGRDFDRKLNNKGRIQANVIGHLLKEKQFKADRIFSSNASRTTETIEIVNEILSGGSQKIEFQPQLYLCDLNSYLDFCFKLNDQYDTVIICGHNYGITDCLNYFTELNQELSTCGTALITFDADSWQEISKGTGVMEWMKLPREIVE